MQVISSELHKKFNICFELFTKSRFFIYPFHTEIFSLSPNQRAIGTRRHANMMCILHKFRARFSTSSRIAQIFIFAQFYILLVIFWQGSRIYPRFCSLRLHFGENSSALSNAGAETMPRAPEGIIHECANAVRADASPHRATVSIQPSATLHRRAKVIFPLVTQTSLRSPATPPLHTLVFNQTALMGQDGSAFM